MGSEQSSRRENREPAATPREVENALDQQRKMYEQRMKQLLEEAKSSGTATTARAAPPAEDPLNKLRANIRQQQTASAELHREPAATTREVENALEKQRKMYEQKMKQLLEEAKSSGTATTARAAPPADPNKHLATAGCQQQIAPAEFIERQRNPYSYNQSVLHSQRNLNIGPLYPNLGNACSAPPQGNNNMASPMHPSPYGPGYGGAIYVNSTYQNQQTPQQPAQRNSPLQPSAPPSEISSTNSRSRSQSRQRGGDNDVNCVTCGKMYGERIYQCNLGHSSCELCKMRQVQCGQCRQQLTNRRNFDLEKYVMERRIRCPNSTDGCRLFIKMADMAIHEKECPFKALQCPSLGSSCNWRGKMSQLPDHFNEMHPLHNQGEVDKEMFMSNISNASHTMHYIRIGNFNFLFHIKVSEADARIYMAIQLIGTKHSAAKWDYEIHLYKKNEPRRKYQYTDRCSSTIESLEEIISSTQCAVVPQEYAKTFLYGGSVAYKFYIKREDFKTNESARCNNRNTTGEKDNGSRTRQRNNYKKFVKKY